MGEKRRVEKGEGLEEHDEQHTAEGLRAHQSHEDAGREAPGKTGEPAHGVLVQVCEQCGKEYFFDDEQPPDDLTCEKCGGRVFRSFYDVSRDDEAARDFEESTERDLATDAGPSDVERGDVSDLNNP